MLMVFLVPVIFSSEMAEGEAINDGRQSMKEKPKANANY